MSTRLSGGVRALAVRSDGVRTAAAASILERKAGRRVRTGMQGEIDHPGTVAVVASAERAAEALWREADRFDLRAADLEAMVRPLREAGLFAACLPRDAGGAGLATDPEASAALEAVLRQVGGASLPAGRLFEGHANAVKLVFLYGSDTAKRGFGDDVAAGAVSGVWNAEAAGGLVLGDGAGGPVLDGAKIYCSGAGWLARPLVTARSGKGPVLCAPRELGGMEVDLSGWRASGMRATATGTVGFRDQPLAEAEIVGAPGDYLREPAFKGGAWRFAAVQLGGAERLFGLLLQHLRARGRAADPHQRARVGHAAVAIGTARLWVASARRVVEGGHADAAAYASLARTAVEAACVDLLRLVDRSVGLEARMEGSPIERVSRDLATYLRQPFPDGALDEAAGVRLQAADASPHAEWTRPA